MTDPRTEQAPSSFAPDADPEPYDVDALQLLATVRMRRHLRTLVLLCILALPAWVGLIVAVQAWVPRSYHLRYQIDDDAGAGSS